MREKPHFNGEKSQRIVQTKKALDRGLRLKI
jgi:hypothetical protein